jgi:RNA polymerase sigma factor (sigma-70 family)
MPTKKQASEDLLDSLLGFKPEEQSFEWIFKNYRGKTVSYKEIEKIFLLDCHPNYQTGVLLSIFDLCGAKIHPNKDADLPPVSISGNLTYRGGGTFVDDYIREISVFPTLNREEEGELAKLMEVAYIRYKYSLCHCPAVLDLLDEKFKEVANNPSGEYDFSLSKLKALVIPGSSTLGYPQLWNVIKHQWEKIMTIREQIKSLGVEMHEKSDQSKSNMFKLLSYKAGAAFILKDLNLREAVFHEIREILPDHYSKYPHLKQDFIRVERCYDRYIECKNLMVNYNLKLVVSIARKFFKAKVSPMDVIQYGNEGLIRAAEDYNYKLKFKFSTYAIWWIRQKIQEGIQEQEHMIRIPAYRLHLNRKYNAIKERMSQEGGGIVSDDELSKELEMTIEQVKKLRNDPAAFIISPSSSSGDDDGGNILEQLVDEHFMDEEATYDEDATQALKSHLRLYPVRERFILALRYGLDCEDIRPVAATEESLEAMFSEMGEDTSDDDLDKSINPILYRFENLPTEVKVSVEDLKKLKEEQQASIEFAKEICPFSDDDLEQWRQQAKMGESLSVEAQTVLALVDSRDFANCIKFKARDRLILNHIWLEKELKPSVVRKIIKREGLILEDVAKAFGLTKERVRQLEAKILRNISYHLVLP